METMEETIRATEPVASSQKTISNYSVSTSTALWVDAYSALHALYTKTMDAARNFYGRVDQDLDMEIGRAFDAFDNVIRRCLMDSIADNIGSEENVKSASTEI